MSLCCSKKFGSIGAEFQLVEKAQRKLGFFAFMWYNIGEGS